jgi:ribosome-associated translation inhibitor RaiA
MRITLSGINIPISDDKRAYAEYRFFTSIAPHEVTIRSVNVVIRRDSAANRSFLCTVVVDLGSSGRIKTQARAVHPSAAIDRAADRTAWLVSRRADQDFSPKSRHHTDAASGIRTNRSFGVSEGRFGEAQTRTARRRRVSLPARGRHRGRTSRRRDPGDRS